MTKSPSWRPWDWENTTRCVCRRSCTPGRPRGGESIGVLAATRRNPLGTQCHTNYLHGSRLTAGAQKGTPQVQSAGQGPETTGRHRRVAAPPLTDTGRHRAVTIPPAPAPTPAEPVRRRHAMPDSLRSRPLRTRGRTPQRLLAGTTLLAIAMAPVLARSTTGLGMHDAVAAELAANSGQAEDTLEQLSRGGILAGLSTPTPTPGPSASAGSSSTASPGSAASRGGAQDVGGQDIGGQKDGEPSSATGSSASSPAPTSAPTSNDSTTGSPSTGSQTTGPTTPKFQSQAPDVTPLTPTPSAPEEQAIPEEPEPSDAPTSEEDTTAPQTTEAPTPTGEPSETPGNVVETVIGTPTDTLGG
jgi:hypothetical protein